MRVTICGLVATAAALAACSTTVVPTPQTQLVTVQAILVCDDDRPRTTDPKPTQISVKNSNIVGKYKQGEDRGRPTVEMKVAEVDKKAKYTVTFTCGDAEYTTTTSGPSSTVVCKLAANKKSCKK